MKRRVALPAFLVFALAAVALVLVVNRSVDVEAQAGDPGDIIIGGLVVDVGGTLQVPVMVAALPATSTRLAAYVIRVGINDPAIASISGLTGPNATIDSAIVSPHFAVQELDTTQVKLTFLDLANIYPPGGKLVPLFEVVVSGKSSGLVTLDVEVLDLLTLQGTTITGATSSSTVIRVR